MAHEDLNRTQSVEGSSDRAFGLVFAGVFLVISLLAAVPRGAAAVVGVWRGCGDLRWLRW